MARFSFTGMCQLNTDEASKGYYLRTGKTSAGTEYQSINLGVAAEKNNRAYTEMFGSVGGSIKTMDTDNKKIEIAWADRFDADVVKAVASYKKNVIKIGDTRHEFISPYDAIKFIVEHEAELKDTKITAIGLRSKNFYNNKLTDRFQISNIYTVDNDTKNKLQVTMEFFFTKDSVDAADWTNEHKIYLNGYTNEYINKEYGNKYVPQQIVFDATKVDWNNDKHVAFTKLKLKSLGIDLDGNKIINKLKSGKVYKLNIVTTYQNGSEAVDFTFDMLTDTQKEYVNLGLKTVDDFRPAGSIYGDRVVAYKFSDADLRGEYVDGMITLDDKLSEFEDEIFVIGATESVDDVVEKAAAKSELSDNSDLEDLFD